VVGSVGKISGWIALKVGPSTLPTSGRIQDIWETLCRGCMQSRGERRQRIPAAPEEFELPGDHDRCGRQ